MSEIDVPGTVVTDTATVTITNVAPTASLLAPSAARPGEVVSLRAFARDPGVSDVLTYAWDLGDGTNATGREVEHAFTAGTHEVSLTVSDGDGGTALIRRTIMVNPEAAGDRQLDSRGTDFWIAMMTNLQQGVLDPQVLITSEVATEGVVEIPGLHFRAPFSVADGSVARVRLPDSIVSGGAPNVAPWGIHVSSMDPVAVYGLNQGTIVTDGFLALPREALGEEYVAVGHPGFSGGELGILATRNNTTVRAVNRNGQELTRTLDAGDVALLLSGTDDGLGRTEDGSIDYTGFRITADHPVAAFSGALCGNVPTTVGACNHLVEQLPTTSQWGRRFFTAPYATRVGGDLFRVVASQADTRMSIDGVEVATLGASDYYQQVIGGGSEIESTKPVLVAQFAHSWGRDLVTGDPSMSLVVPYEQYDSSYVVATPLEGFESHFLNVVVPAQESGTVRLDGEPVTATYTPIGQTGWAWAQLPVAAGSHRIRSQVPFGLTQYGWGDFDAYSWPGGMRLAAVAEVTRVTLTPEELTAPVGQSACLTVRVESGAGATVSDARVDWNVSGTNTDAGSVTTGEDGTTQICITGTRTGRDTVTATVGTFSDVSAVTWAEAGPPVAVGYSVDTDEDEPVAVPLSGADPQDCALTFAIAVAPSHGSPSGQPADPDQYTPAKDFAGADLLHQPPRAAETESVRAGRVPIVVAPVQPLSSGRPAVPHHFRGHSPVAPARRVRRRQQCLRLPDHCRPRPRAAVRPGTGPLDQAHRERLRPRSSPPSRRATSTATPRKGGWLRARPAWRSGCAGQRLPGWPSSRHAGSAARTWSHRRRSWSPISTRRRLDLRATATWMAAGEADFRRATAPLGGLDAQHGAGTDDVLDDVAARPGGRLLRRGLRAPARRHGRRRPQQPRTGRR